jgi:hypothetical protein
MSELRNWRYEKFAEQVEAVTPPAEAYVIAGFTAGSRNHNRLLRNEKIAARIGELRRERALRLRASRVPIDELQTELRKCGIDVVANFFGRNAAGILSVRDLQIVRPEMAIALLRFLHEGLRIPRDLL